jgi:hypothetical protein
MSDQLTLFSAPSINPDSNIDIWEKEHIYTPPKKYWQDLIPGEICKNTTRWGDNRLCVLKKIVGEVFGRIEYLDNGEKCLLSLSCLVPVSAADIEGQHE